MHEATGKFGGEISRIRRASAITADEQFVAGTKTFLDQSRRAQQRLLQRSKRLGRRDCGFHRRVEDFRWLSHDALSFRGVYGSAQIPIVTLKTFDRVIVIALQLFGDEARRAVAQFCARRGEIDHRVRAHFAERNHRSGADDVERNLGRRAGL